MTTCLQNSPVVDHCVIMHHFEEQLHMYDHIFLPCHKTITFILDKKPKTQKLNLQIQVRSKPRVYIKVEITQEFT